MQRGQLREVGQTLVAIASSSAFTSLPAAVQQALLIAVAIRELGRATSISHTVPADAAEV